MLRIVGGLVVLALALPARADDKPPDKGKATPAEQYQALLKEYNEEETAFDKAMGAAKTPEEQQKVFQEKRPKPEKYAARFLEIAQKNPKDAVAVDALVWIVTNGTRLPKDQAGVTEKAVAQLVRDHVESEKLGLVCRNLAFSYGKSAEQLLRALVDKSPHKKVQAQAASALAQAVGNKMQLAQRLKDDKTLLERVKQVLGQEAADDLAKADIAKMEAEGAKLYADLAEKYVPEMTPQDVMSLIQGMRFQTDKASEALLRALASKDKRDEVQGPATLTLAQLLKGRLSAVKDAAELPKMRKEIEDLLERAAEKFADVKMAFGGTVGAAAKKELFALRNLGVGKPAPDVEGVDQDGKTFKLSDYRGKVVLLDFWSQY